MSRRIQNQGEAAGRRTHPAIQKETDSDYLGEIFHRILRGSEEIAFAGRFPLQLPGMMGVDELKQSIPVLKCGVGPGQDRPLGPETVRRREVELRHHHRPIEQPRQHQPGGGFRLAENHRLIPQQRGGIPAIDADVDRMIPVFVDIHVVIRGPQNRRAQRGGRILIVERNLHSDLPQELFQIVVGFHIDFREEIREYRVVRRCGTLGKRMLFPPLREPFPIQRGALRRTKPGPVDIVLIDQRK